MDYDQCRWWRRADVAPDGCFCVIALAAQDCGTPVRSALCADLHNRSCCRRAGDVLRAGAMGGCCGLVFDDGARVAFAGQMNALALYRDDGPVSLLLGRAAAPMPWLLAVVGMAVPAV